MSRSGRGEHVFLVQTAYHVLMAAGLAEHLRRSGRGPSRLLCIDDFKSAGDFYDALAEWPATPFTGLVRLGTYRRHAGRNRKKASVRELNEAIRAQLHGPLNALYVFNDRNAFAQVALQEAARLHPAAERVAVEDGSAAYSEQRYRRYNKWRAYLHRRRYGRGWHNVQVLGTHPLVQRFIGHFPEAFRPELAAKRCERYPTEILAQLPLDSFARQLGLRLGVDPAPWQDIDVLVAVPGEYVLDFNPDYGSRMHAIIEALSQAGLSIGIKYHPRERAADFLDVARLPHVRELPRAIPMECLYLLLDARPRIALGDISSAFMLADKFNPGMRPVVFRHGEGFHDYNLTRQFGRLQIEVVEDCQSLISRARDRIRGAKKAGGGVAAGLS